MDKDLRLDRIFAFAFGLLLLLAAAAIVGWFYFDSQKRHLASQDPPPSPLVDAWQEQAPPEPRLQSDPAADMAAFRARQEASLRSYGWVDKQAGIARIPVDRAMHLLVERGLRPAMVEPAADLAADGGAPDAGGLDGGVADGGGQDAGALTTDAGSLDGGAPDGAAPDGGAR